MMSPKLAEFGPGEVTVRASRPSVIDRATTQVVIGAEDIEAHRDRNIADTLRFVPGIGTYQHGKGHVRFRMYGFEMPYVALLVDGIPIADVYEANIDISKLPVLNVSKIIVDRGTSSALYGSNATVGSINIVTMTPMSFYASAQSELDTTGSYSLHLAHGDVLGKVFYWVTGTVQTQQPFQVSQRLDREFWLRSAMPRGLGYTVDRTSPAAQSYLDVDEWPHQEGVVYAGSGKVGYRLSEAFETGVALNYSKSEAQRYSLTANTTEEYSQGAWPATDPTPGLIAGAFNWHESQMLSVAPYAQYEDGAFSSKGNVYYQRTNEILDGYQDAGETVPIRGWGGATSNWRNTSAGFNWLPSYAFADWNQLNGSALFRWDKHVERIRADRDFVGDEAAGGGADAAYDLAGYDWAITKVMTGAQVTVALEDALDLGKLAGIPLDVSAGASYDAQKVKRYDSRSQTMEQGRVVEYGRDLEGQYIASSDSALWGSRDSFNPVFGAIYEPIPRVLRLRAALSRKARLPTLSQYAKVYEDSDVGLRPEVSTNANVGTQLSTRSDLASLRFDVFMSRFRDKLATVYDPETPSLRYYTNIDGENHFGGELTLRGHTRLSSMADFSATLGYTYLRVNYVAPNQGDSTISKGRRVPDIPKHEITYDFRWSFQSQTQLSVFGSYMANAVRYTMAENPAPGEGFAVSVYRTYTLNDRFLLNAQLSQGLGRYVELYTVGRNLLDDFEMDPFNPGPGREFALGAKVTY